MLPILLGWCCFTLVALVTRLVGHPTYAFTLVGLVDSVWVRFTSRAIHFGLVAPLWFGRLDPAFGSHDPNAGNTIWVKSRPQMIVFRKYTFALVGLVDCVWVRFTSRAFHFGLVTSLWFGHLGPAFGSHDPNAGNLIWVKSSSQMTVFRVHAFILVALVGRHLGYFGRYCDRVIVPLFWQKWSLSEHVLCFVWLLRSS